MEIQSSETFWHGRKYSSSFKLVSSVSTYCNILFFLSAFIFILHLIQYHTTHRATSLQTHLYWKPASQNSGIYNIKKKTKWKRSERRHLLRAQKMVLKRSDVYNRVIDCQCLCSKKHILSTSPNSMCLTHHQIPFSSPNACLLF